ncbi:hypothetical protein JDV02_009924 [Purpureocillium takamizusanense]|uniref:NADH oxidase n=1 Tax=Purpureocillium takamizusanense TaxID=2060973 RepID=A0A9Q8QSR1_9HYPO|nr:uncharacterized protein JDV02_009924 [Purpureocillium takamizusanense]UNI24151.1 hypothetical protein JDV02_009924 [Purpureocillium takamizusanense]
MLCTKLEEHGFDFVDLSGGTYQEPAMPHRRESTKTGEALFLDFAEKTVPALSKTKGFVAGGLRTVPAMVRALESVDGIGLGRPLCSEFDLAQRIIDGKASRALCGLLDEQAYNLTKMARKAGGQQRWLEVWD